MPQIHVLDSETIDKIAAGEVVERPSSVVKELVENAIDAGANAITVEIKEGGISFIRVTDNGSGMDKSQIRTAFLRHATSKIQNSDDLLKVSSLGFRGEALSSISAVSKVEVITKTKNSLVGSRIILEGAREVSFEEIGAPDGTTFIVRNLFFNTPVRRKFLKQPATEGGYIVDLMEHLALSRPDISFQLIVGSQLKFQTSGNSDLREVIYRIYGREVAKEIVPIQVSKDGTEIEGYLGKPIQVRSNRNFEIYFINGRFIKSGIIARAIEEGYKEYLMQHKFPFCVLHIKMDPQRVDVNVHPTKMDVRFSNALEFSAYVCGAVKYALIHQEMIPDARLTPDREIKAQDKTEHQQIKEKHILQPFEIQRSENQKVMEKHSFEATNNNPRDLIGNPVWNRVNSNTMKENNSSYNRKVVEEKTENFFTETIDNQIMIEQKGNDKEKPSEESELAKEMSQKEESVIHNTVQMDLFEDKILTKSNRPKFRIVGQIFDTYWLIEFEDKLLMIDQHAAHEKVNYERLMKQYHEKSVVTQSLMPPIVVSLTGQEESILKENIEIFKSLGFDIDEFGGNEYTLRSVPVDLYGCGEKEMFLEVLDQLSEGGSFGVIRVIEEKIASMSCKAAVKGNQMLSISEAEKLIDELLTLENPYNCPHGRPTIISMTKQEMEHKFRRIV